MAADITKTGVGGLKGLKGVNQQQDEFNPQTATPDDWYRRYANKSINEYNNAPVEYAGVQAANIGYGKSKYDEGLSSASQLDNLEDLRYQNQPWWDVLGNGLVKMGGTALTTFLSAFGTPLVGIPTAIAEGRFSGLWDNQFSQAMSDMDNYLEENFKNYQSEEQQNEKWWQRLDDMNWWADDVIKNIGFTLGAAASGAMFAGSLGLMSNVLKIANTASKASKIATSAASALFSAAGEGAIEAKNLMEDQRTTLEQQLEESLRPEIERIQAEYDANRGRAIAQTPEGRTFDPAYEKYKREMAVMQKRLADGKQEINERVHKAGNADFLLNIPLLTVDNLIQFGKGFNKSYANARRVAEQSKKSVGAGRVRTTLNQDILNKAARGEALKEGEKILEVSAKEGSRGGKAWAILKNPLAEGSEEMNQQFISAASGKYYASEDANEYWEAKSDDEAIRNTVKTDRNLFDAMSYGLNNSWFDGDQWEQFAIGALTGALGIPMLGVKTKTDKEGNKYRGLGFSWEGGSYNAIKDYNEEVASGQDLRDNLASRIGDEGFVSRLRNQVAHSYYQNNADEYIKEGDKKKAKDEMDKQFAVDVESFVRAGKTDDLRAIYQAFAESDLTDEEVEQYIESATRSTTAQQDADFQRLTLSPQLEKLDNAVNRAQASVERAQARYKKKRIAKNRKSLENAQNRLIKAQEKFIKVESDYDAIQGADTTTNPYLDSKGNPIDKDGKIISKEQLYDNIRQEIQDNGVKAMQNLDLYLNAADETNRDTRGELSNEQEEYLTFHNYRSKRSEQRAKDTITKTRDSIPSKIKVDSKLKDRLQKIVPNENFINEEVNTKTGEVTYTANLENLDNDAYFDVFRAIAASESQNQFEDGILNDAENKIRENPKEARNILTNTNTILDDLSDTYTLLMDSFTHKKTYQDGVNNPDAIAISAKKVVDEKIKESKTEEAQEKFEGKTSKEIKAEYTAEGIDSFLSEWQAGNITPEDNTVEAVKGAKEMNDKQQSLQGYAAQIDDREIAEDANTMIQWLGDAAENANEINPDELANFDANALISSEQAAYMYERGFTDEQIGQEAEARKQKAINELYKAIDAFQKDEDKKSIILEEGTQAGKFEDFETGNDAVAKTGSNQNGNADLTKGTVVITNDAPTVTGEQAQEAVKRAMEEQWSVTPTGNGTWRNNTRRYGYHSTSKAYHETLTDQNSLLYRRSKAIHDYLEGQNAFENIENASEDRVKKGDAVRFKVVSLHKQIVGKDNLSDCTEEEKKQSMVILMVVTKGNNAKVIGDVAYPDFEKGIRNGNPTKEEIALNYLYTQASKALIEANAKDSTITESYLDGKDGLGLKFKTGRPLVGTINEVIGGVVPYNENRSDVHTLNEVAGDRLRIGVKVMQGNIVVGRNKSVRLSSRNGLDSAGQPYIIIDDASGFPKAAPFFTPNFNAESMRNTKLYKTLHDALSVFEKYTDNNDKNQKDIRLGAVKAISSLLQVYTPFIEVQNDKVVFYYYEQPHHQKGELKKSITVSKKDSSDWITELLSKLNDTNIQVSIDAINSNLYIDKQYVPYNEIIGEIATINLPENTTHTVNSWVLLNNLTEEGNKPTPAITYPTGGTRVYTIGNREVAITAGDTWSASDPKTGEPIVDDMEIDLAMAAMQAANRRVVSGKIRVDINGEVRHYNVKEKAFVEEKKPEASATPTTPTGTPIERAIAYILEHPKGTMDELQNAAGVEGFFFIPFLNEIQREGVVITGKNGDGYEVSQEWINARKKPATPEGNAAPSNPLNQVEKNNNKEWLERNNTVLQNDYNRYAEENDGNDANAYLDYLISHASEDNKKILNSIKNLSMDEFNKAFETWQAEYSRKKSAELDDMLMGSSQGAGTTMTIEEANQQARDNEIVIDGNEAVWNAIPEDMRVAFVSGTPLNLTYGRDSKTITFDNSQFAQQAMVSLVSKVKRNPAMLKVEQAPKAKAKEGIKIDRENERRARQWLAKNLPSLNSEERTQFVEKLTQAGDDASKLWATYRNGVIQILRNAPMGTVYHEAFHYVMDMVLPYKEKQQLLSIAREHYGKNLTDLELEERLAEDFRMYALNENDTSILGRLKRWFRKIMDAIRRYNRIDDATVNQVFWKINNGEFAQRSLSAESFKGYQRRVLEEIDNIHKKKYEWKNLKPSTRESIKEYGITEEVYKDMSIAEKENWVKCRG